MPLLPMYLNLPLLGCWLCIGLAGELGVALSWISESLDRRQRTVATMIVSCIGLFGGIAAAFIGSIFYWKTSYIIGGVMGLILLVLRISRPGKQDIY
jgi:MFS family permease